MDRDIFMIKDKWGIHENWVDPDSNNSTNSSAETESGKTQLTRRQLNRKRIEQDLYQQ